MTKLIWMSDPHFTHDGLVLGHDPRVRLQAAIAHINANHADAAMCVISGDLVNRETRTDYEALSAMLTSLAVPYFPMVGNHDDRDLLRKVLPVPDTCLSGFIQYEVETDQGLVVCLDTHKSGSDAGEFCQSRRDWLHEALSRAGDKPVYLFMHHPPMALGLPMQDSENMEDGKSFLDLVSNFPCVRYLFIGHVHRPISGTVRGLPFSTMRSVLYQAPPPRPEWTWDTFRPADEAPNIGVIELGREMVALHYDQFCDYRMGIAGD